MAKTNFLKNAGIYTSASFLSVLASIVSFPILTRLFEVGEYGMLGLVTGTIPLLVGIGKVGMQHASLRFYAEINSGKSQWSSPEYFSSLYLTLLMAGGALFLIWNGVVLTVGEMIFSEPTLCMLFVICSYIVFFQILESAILNVLQAQEKAFQHTVFKVSKRFVVLGVTLAVIIFYRADLVPYFVALAIAEAILILGFAVYHVPFKSIRFSFYRTGLVKAMMVFGIPMFGMEFGGAIMNVADRYIINAYLDSEALGAYSSAHTLVNYAQNIVATALIASAIPTFLRLNADQSLHEAQRFLTNALQIYIWASVPIIFLLASAGEAGLRFLAGDGYAAGAVVMPWVAAGIGLFGVFELVAAGLYLSKNTGKMFYIILGTAAANVVLNLLTIPVFGLIGAAFSTLLCYVGCIIVSYQWGSRYLHIQIPWRSLFAALLAGTLMYGLLDIWSPSQIFWELVYKGVLGVMIYSLIVLLLDCNARAEFDRFLPQRV